MVRMSDTGEKKRVKDIAADSGRRLGNRTGAPLRPIRLQVRVSFPAVGALEPRLHGQELGRLAGAVRGKLFERDRALMAAEGGQAPSGDAIDPVAPAMAMSGREY